MFRTNFEIKLGNATSNLHLEPDWPSILELCDEINQKDISPKAAFAAIKKKMQATNPHTACYALLVLESAVKNCGAPMHDEVFTKENCEMFSNFLEQTPHENVRQKMLELVQTWANAFRSGEKYQAIKDTMTILKTKGHVFPELKEADAMFAADTAPNWVDGKVCHRCRDEFSFTNRKHHCRNCGQVFCGQCTSKQCPLPKYGIEKDVRVCEGCFFSFSRPTSAKSLARAQDSDLPAEYLKSPLSQQVQTPPRKTEQELKEEEELQLALALSKSMAEEDKKNPKKQQPYTGKILVSYRAPQRSPSPEPLPVLKEYQQQQEENPDLAKYLNRSYWENRKISETSIASPSAPSPMPATPQPQQLAGNTQVKPDDELHIDEFAANMRTQVEIFVNRMKSNSSRGRSIANDSSVETLFMTLTNMHSQQLSYIKELDDKRMWYEQLQDKLTQIRDSRAALDVLRQEHVDKLRRMAEEQERQRQIQMAQKLEIMRKKKQEYLQYQRQLALQRIQEQEMEMQMRQEQQKVQYRMGQQTAFPFAVGMPAGASPSHQQMNNTTIYNPYAYNPSSPAAVNATPYSSGIASADNSANGAAASAGAQSAAAAGMTLPPGMYAPGGMVSMANHNPQHPGMLLQAQMNANMLPPNNAMMQLPGVAQQPMSLPGVTMDNGSMPANQVNMQQQQPQQQEQQQQQQQQQQTQLQQQQPQLQQPSLQQTQPPQHPQLAHVMLQQSVVQAQQPIPNPNDANINNQQLNQIQANAQIQALAAAPVPPQNEPEPAVSAKKAEEPPTAELISFD